MGDAADDAERRADREREENAASMLPMKRYLVTCTESVKVWARGEADAENKALDAFAWGGDSTEDIQVEELED
jgi:hypothetical protein